MEVNFIGVNQCKREVPIIVSLTSSEENFNDLPRTLSSLLNQSIKPDRIILWLDEDCYDLIYLSYEITKFIKNGLEIRFVKNLKSYTNLINSFKDYSDSIIVNAADNVYYPSDWLKKLYLSYISNPSDIHAHKVYKVDLNNPFENWDKYIKEERASYSYLGINAGGVLYPPNCFSKEVLREDIFLKEAPDFEDIWFWVMALVNGRKIRLVKNHMKYLFFVNIFRNFFHPKINYESRNMQFQNLMKYYGQNIIRRL